MIEHMEQYEYRGSQWFYAALQNVESVVVDGYWQMFLMSRSCVALMLAIFTLVFKAIYKNGSNLDVSNFVPAFILLILTPVCFLLVLGRRRTGAMLIEAR